MPAFLNLNICKIKLFKANIYNLNKQSFAFNIQMGYH